MESEHSSLLKGIGTTDNDLIPLPVGRYPKTYLVCHAGSMLDYISKKFSNHRIASKSHIFIDWKRGAFNSNSNYHQPFYFQTKQI